MFQYFYFYGLFLGFGSQALSLILIVEQRDMVILKLILVKLTSYFPESTKKFSMKYYVIFVLIFSNAQN